MSWNSPPGVHATLQMIGDSNLVFGLAGTSAMSWEDSRPTVGGGIQPYQYSDIAGWVLTTLTDGTQYFIMRGSPTNIVTLHPDGSDQEISARVYGPPKLTMIKPVSGDMIVITNTGIFHYDPSNHLTRAILFDYDSQGRITALHDPNGGSNGLPAVKYL